MADQNTQKSGSSGNIHKADVKKKEKELHFDFSSHQVLRKKISEENMMQLLTASIRRRLKRGLGVREKKLLKKIELFKQKKIPRVRTHLRSMPILPSMVGVNVFVHGGKEWVNVTITEEMVGYRLGEFAPTRRPVKHSAPGIGATKSTAHASVK